MRKKQSVNFLKLAQIMCLALMAFSMEWALWNEFSFSSLLFPAACIGGVVFTFLYVAPYLEKFPWKHIIPEYMFFLFWIIIMVVANEGFYKHYRKITFIFLTMDAHAIFFIRLLVAVIPFMFLVDYGKFKETKFFKIILGLIIGTNAFYTFRAVRFFPDAIRARGTMEYIGGEEFLYATPDYAMVYGMALIFPVFLQKIKNAQTKEDRIIYSVFAALVFYVVAVSQFATALLIAIVGALVFLLFSMSGNKRLTVLLVMVFLLFYVHITKMDVALLDALANSIQGTWVDKLHDISETLSGSALSGSLSERNDLYQESLKTFLESPFLGVMANTTGSLGGHSTAIDILGLVGIFGFIPFVLTIVYNFKRVCRTCNFPKNKAAIIACNIEFIVLIFTKNIITSLSVFFAFFVVFPLLLKIESENTEERR